MKKIIRHMLVLTAFFAVSTSVVFAQLPYNQQLTQNQYNNGSIVVTKEGQQKWENNGVRLGTTGIIVGNWDDKYIVIALDKNSIPNQLTFRYKCNSVIATNPNWYVAESSDQTNWSKVWSAVTPTSSSVSVSTDWVTADPINLSKSTKYIKLCYSGNYAGTYADIQVSDQAYVHDPMVNDAAVSSLDFGAGAISSGTVEQSFAIEWCNVNALNVTCDNTTFFSVSPASFGGKAKYGTQTVTVTYDRDKEVGEHTATVTATNGTHTKTVSLHGSTTKRNQEIHWNSTLASLHFTMNAEESLSGEAIATADNEDAVLTYTSSDENVIAVSPDGQTLYAVDNGSATVTVFASGNNVYNETSEARLFTVTADRKQVIEWEQNLMGLKTNASPNTIALDAIATSGGVITYAIEGGSAECITLGGANNATLTITGTPGEAYIIATQAGGEINGEMWISTTARKQVKVRDPNSSCDEYALADRSFTFAKGHKTSFSVQEYNLAGKPTQLTFTAKAGGTQYVWSEREAIYVEQYANFGSGHEWHQLAALTMDESSKSYGPYNLDESATKIRFRSGDYSEQTVSNITIPRKKELLVSETSISENAERNVRWSKQISVSRSNIDAVDIYVESSDAECPFEVSKTSIGTDCSDRTTETFEVSLTPHEKNKTYTGTITITDGKATPTTRTVELSLTAVAFNQSIVDFELPEQATTTSEIAFHATATSELEVVYLSSDSTVAYVDNNNLVILAAGTVDITAYQEGNDRYNSASLTKTVTISLTPSEVYMAPTASSIVEGQTLADAALSGGQASVEGTFAWLNPETALQEAGEYTFPVLFTPANASVYASQTVDVTVNVMAYKQTQTITWEDSIPALFIGQTYLVTATASSALPVQFISSDSTVAYVNAENLLVAVDSGKVTISAIQAGDGLYEAAEPVVRQITILPLPTTYGVFETSLCYGDSVEFAGQWYKSVTQEDILLEQRNSQGGDSIVHFSVAVNPTYLFEDSLSFPLGQSPVWQDINLGALPEGDTTLIVRYESAQGCDSLHVLHLTVLPMVITYGNYEASFCQGDSVEFAGQWYKAVTQEDILLEQRNSQGGDSIVHLSVAVNPTYLFEDSLSFPLGQSPVWQDINLGALPEGDTTLIVRYESAQGCDSLHVLHLTVLPMVVTYGNDTIRLCAGERYVYEGKTYRHSTVDSVKVSERNQFGGDSIVELVVYVFPSLRVGNSMTITEGDSATWQGIDLSGLSAGDTTLIVAYTSIHGCDSVYMLELTVKEAGEMALDEIDATQAAEKFFHNGQLYIRKNRHVYNLQGIKVEIEY